MQDDAGEVETRNKEMEAERMKIESDNRGVMRRVFRVEEQKVPFPSLIKVDQSQITKGQKVVHDLKEAVQLVKVCIAKSYTTEIELKFHIIMTIIKGFYFSLWLKIRNK